MRRGSRRRTTGAYALTPAGHGRPQWSSPSTRSCSCDGPGAGSSSLSCSGVLHSCRCGSCPTTAIAQRVWASSRRRPSSSPGCSWRPRASCARSWMMDGIVYAGVTAARSRAEHPGGRGGRRRMGVFSTPRVRASARHGQAARASTILDHRGQARRRRRETLAVVVRRPGHGRRRRIDGQSQCGPRGRSRDPIRPDRAHASSSSSPLRRSFR